MIENGKGLALGTFLALLGLTNVWTAAAIKDVQARLGRIESAMMVRNPQ